MRKILLFIISLSFVFSHTIQSAPIYLYKILSVDDWNASQDKKIVQLSPKDNAFIHFAKENQLNKITSKYWSDVPVFVILKIEYAKLLGTMKLENGYYHLYNGSIPFYCVTEVIYCSC